MIKALYCGMDSVIHDKKQIEKFGKYESLCMRCGRCCGVYDGDPCANLAEDTEGKYHCNVYEDRLGPQRTVTGRAFTCVPIREVAKSRVPYAGCPYVKNRGNYL